MSEKFIITIHGSKTYYTGNQSFSNNLINANFYDTYDEAKNVLRFLPQGIYQIEKVFSIVQGTLPL